MATASIMDFLAGDALTELARAYSNRPGLVRPLPAAFYTPGPTKPVGTTVKYRVVTGSRESARVRNSNSPSATVQGVETAEKKVIALGSRENYPISHEVIQALQWPGDMVRARAAAEVNEQIENFVGRFVSLRTNAVHSALLRGKIDIATTGLIQTSTSSPSRTIDYAVPTANLITKDGAGSTYNIGDWSSAAVDIPNAVRELKRFMSKTYGFSVTTAYYGVDVPGYLAKNTLFKEYLSRNVMFRDQFVSTGAIPNGVLGLNWVDVGDATSVTDGTGTSFAADNFIAFSPNPEDTSWYEFVECGLAAPTGLASEASITQAILSPEGISNAFPIKYGVHSYSLMNADPISAKLIVADYTVPIIKAPNAYTFGTCS